MNPNYDWCGHEGCGAPIERWSREWRHSRSAEADLDHKAFPQEPVGAMEEGLHMRATRYAEALAAAAAADERITVLTELLAQHEYYRSQAEQALSSVQEDPDYGTVWAPTGPEPDEDEVAALLCLTTGQVYRRRQYGTGWQKAEYNPSTATGYEWPIQDAGPFIAWRDDYGFDHVLRQARKAETEFDALHRKLYSEPGYRAEGGGYGRPPLVEAIGRILTDRSEKWSEQLHKTQTAESKLAKLRRSIEYLTPDDTQQWPMADLNDDVRQVSVVDLQRVLDLLDKPEHGGAA